MAKVEVQGGPAHQLLLAQWASVLRLHCMLGEGVSSHLLTLWAQEATIGTAVYLGAHTGTMNEALGAEDRHTGITRTHPLHPLAQFWGIGVLTGRYPHQGEKLVSVPHISRTKAEAGTTCCSPCVFSA